MDYRDERGALLIRVANLEHELAEAKRVVAEHEAERDRAARQARLEDELASAKRLLEKLSQELAESRVEGPHGPARRKRGGQTGAAAPTPVRRVVYMAVAVGVAAASWWLVSRSAQPAGPSPRAPELDPPAPPRAERTRADPPFDPGNLWPMFARDPSGAVTDPVVWGRARGISCLARFSGRTGEREWLACPYGPPNGGPWADDQNRSALVDDAILVALDKDLDLFDARSGVKLWRTRLDDKAWRFCRGTNGAPYVMLERGASGVTVSLATGELHRSPPPEPCEEVWTNFDGESYVGTRPGQHLAKEVRPTSAPSWASPATPAAAGIVTKSSLEIGGRIVVLGQRAGGSQAPAAAAFQTGGELLWTHDLPPAELGQVWPAAAEIAAADDHLLCAVYPASDRARLGCWDVETGTTHWDRAVGHWEGKPSGIVFTGAHVVVVGQRESSSRRRLSFFDLLTGAPRFEL